MALSLLTPIPATCFAVAENRALDICRDLTAHHTHQAATCIRPKFRCHLCLLLTITHPPSRHLYPSEIGRIVR
ncbi:MAG: hypothetical protein IKN91_07460 [Paludibacteraceae bacterium]|nr:hypothetical protein [Paludibacteraceae bacterium]